MNIQPLKNDLDLLQGFTKETNKQKDIVAIEAQKLVNLYRQLSVFRTSFISDFNKMLLESSKDVQMMLSSIVGGSIVRKYLEYLQTELSSQKTQIPSEPNKGEPIQSGYLPNPEEDIPFGIKAENSTQNLSSETINALIESNKAQTVTLDRLIQKFKNNNQLSENEVKLSQETLQSIPQKDLREMTTVIPPINSDIEILSEIDLSQE